VGYADKKPTLIVLALLFLFMGGALLVVFLGDSTTTTQAEVSPTAIKRAQDKALAEISQKDTDGDGLKDWEETLWGTDPNNPDTDGDGTSDGEETRENRNPIDPSKDDSLNISAGEQPQDIKEPSELTETDKVAAIFFKEYVQLREQGGLQDQESVNVLIAKVLRGVATALPRLPEHSIKDILVGPQSGKEAAHSYGNLVILAFQNNLASLQENPLEILVRTLENTDETELSKLDAFETGYKNVEKDLLAIVVPKELAAIHLELVNKFAAFAENVRDMKKALTDPIVVFRVLEPHVRGSISVANAIVELRNYLIKTGVQYEPAEPAWPLINVPIPE
jgi:hypothetical protein